MVRGRRNRSGCRGCCGRFGGGLRGRSPPPSPSHGEGGKTEGAEEGGCGAALFDGVFGDFDELAEVVERDHALGGFAEFVEVSDVPRDVRAGEEGDGVRECQARLVGEGGQVRIHLGEVDGEELVVGGVEGRERIGACSGRCGHLSFPLAVRLCDVRVYDHTARGGLCKWLAPDVPHLCAQTRYIESKYREEQRYTQVRYRVPRWSRAQEGQSPGKPERYR